MASFLPNLNTRPLPSATLPAKAPPSSSFFTNPTLVAPTTAQEDRFTLISKSTPTPASTATSTPVETPLEAPVETPLETPAETPVKTVAESPASSPVSAEQTDTSTVTSTSTDVSASPKEATTALASASNQQEALLTFAKSPLGIGAGVGAAVLVGIGGILTYNKMNTPIAQLEKAVKALGKDNLSEDKAIEWFTHFNEHLKTLTTETAEHTEKTWESISGAIDGLHQKHGTKTTAQVALLQGLQGDPHSLSSLSESARRAVYNTSKSFVEGMESSSLNTEDARPLVQKAAEWLLHPHGNAGFGIKKEEDLVQTSGSLLKALIKVDPRQEHAPDLSHAMMAFSLHAEHFPELAKGEKAPTVDLDQIRDLQSAGTQLFNARLGNPSQIKNVFNVLNKGIGEGYGTLSGKNGFKHLEAELTPMKTTKKVKDLGSDSDSKPGLKKWLPRFLWGAGITTAARFLWMNYHHLSSVLLGGHG